MTHVDVLDSLYTLVKSAYKWDMIDWGGRPDSVPTDPKATWCRPRITFADGSQGAIKNTNVPWDSRGRMIVQVFVPVGKGESTCYTVAQPMITNLRKLSCGSLMVRRVYPSIVPSERESGIVGWMQLNVNVEFEFSEIV